MRHTAVLDDIYENRDGSGVFTENKSWVQGKKLFEEARLSGQHIDTAQMYREAEDLRTLPS
jgi:hypothetical protein